MSETTMSKTRKAAIAAVLVAGLSGAITVAGISAASSNPGSDPSVTQTDHRDSMDAGDYADCEKFAEDNAMFDHADMGSFSDMMGGNFSDMMGEGSSDTMSGFGRMGA